MYLNRAEKCERENKMTKRKRKLFCEYGPLAYKISLFKECQKRNIKDLLSGEKFAKKKSYDNLEYIWKGDAKILLRKLEGVDMQLQKNKIKNLEIAGKKIDGLIIKPGETFSFWRTVGNATKRKGYLEGLVISDSKLKRGIGGGLCQMANLIHYLVLHTDLEVTELYHHSDALFPDSKRRVPFGTGTSIAYKNLDYRFKNTTKHTIQLRIWQDETMLYGEIRSVVPMKVKYRLQEEGHHYSNENGVYYRNSKVYRIKTDKETKEEICKELILTNHSRVMYDYSLIPKEEILEN